MSLIEKMVETMRDDPFPDDIPLLGTTQQDARMAHYAQAALTAIMDAGDGVQQCDRDAAAAFAAQTSGAAITDPQIQACISGKMDDSLVVQHFARHRSTAAAAERARIVAWLRGQDNLGPRQPGELADSIERGEV